MGTPRLSSLLPGWARLRHYQRAGPALARFPTAALGAIVVYAASRLIDVAEFRRLAAFRRSEILLALAALVGVQVFDILYGVLLAVGLSVAEMLHRVARPHDAVEGFVPDLAGMHDDRTADISDASHRGRRLPRLVPDPPRPSFIGIS